MGSTTLKIEGNKRPPLDRVVVFDNTAVTFYENSLELAEAISLAVGHFGKVYEKAFQLEDFPGNPTRTTILVFSPQKNE